MYLTLFHFYSLDQCLAVTTFKFKAHKEVFGALPWSSFLGLFFHQQNIAVMVEEELKVLRPKFSPLNQVMALILASFSLHLKLRCQIKFLLKHAFIFNGKKQAISKSNSSTLSLIHISRGNQSSSPSTFTSHY